MLMRSPLARERRRPAGFIKPCQPTLSDKAPSGPLWLHEIKHDGYRIIACKSGDQVRLWSRNGRDWSREFLAVTEALRALRVDEIVLDGEAMAHCKDGLPDFWRCGRRTAAPAACLFAFDLLRLNGEDLRPLPLEERRATAADGPQRARQGSALQRAPGGRRRGDLPPRLCLGLEGIVSKRRDGRYRSGRSRGWLKIKNPDYERP